MRTAFIFLCALISLDGLIVAITSKDINSFIVGSFMLFAGSISFLILAPKANKS